MLYTNLLKMHRSKMRAIRNTAEETAIIIITQGSGSSFGFVPLVVLWTPLVLPTLLDDMIVLLDNMIVLLGPSMDEVAKKEHCFVHNWVAIMKKLFYVSYSDMNSLQNL